MPAVDWQAVDAVGTWVVGLAAIAIAIAGFRRDRAASASQARREAQIAITHVDDVFERVSEKRQRVKTFQALMASAGEGNPRAAAIESHRASFDPIVLTQAQRESLALVYDQLAGCNKRLQWLDDTLAGFRFSGQPAVSVVGDFEVAEVKAQDARDALTACKRALDDLRTRLRRALR